LRRPTEGSDAVERELPQQEVSNAVDTKSLHRVARVQDVDRRRTHLLPVDAHEPMRPDPLGWWEAGGHQHGRPVDRGKTRDVFPNDMQVRRSPRLELRRVAAIADAGAVVGEGVAPHIDDVQVVSRAWAAATDGR